MPVADGCTTVVSVRRRRDNHERLRVGEPQRPDAALAEFEQMPIDRIAPHRVGQVALELRRARCQHYAALFGGELLQPQQQARLADPRLTLDHHDPAPRARGEERGYQRLALRHAPDERLDDRGAHTGIVSRKRPRG